MSRHETHHYISLVDDKAMLCLLNDYFVWDIGKRFVYIILWDLCNKALK